MPLFTLRVNVSTHLTAEKLKQLEQYSMLIKQGFEFGFIGSCHDTNVQNLGPIMHFDYTDAKALCINVITDDIQISESDKNLIIRGMLYWLRNLEIGFTNILPVENHLIEENAQFLSLQRNKINFQIFDEEDYWGYGEQIHIYLEFKQPVQSSTIAFLLEAGSLFESLVPWMNPFPGDEYSNIGETAIIHLENNVIDFWIESIFALPFEWKRRFEAFLIKNQNQLQLVNVRYEQ